MELLLISVAVVSLGLAAVMGLVAWKLLRDGKQRSAARVQLLASLAAAADEGGDDLVGHAPAASASVAADAPIVTAQAPAPLPAPSTVEVPAPAPALTPLPVAASARTFEFDAAPVVDAPAVPSARFAALDDADDTDDEGDLADASSTPPTPPMFGATLGRPANGTRRWLALAATVVLVAAGAVGVVKVTAHRSSAVPGADAASRVTGTGTGTASAPAPLELISLRHSAEEAGFFTVTGLVKGPADTRISRSIVAVVYLFAEDGTYFAMGRSPIDRPALAPSEESPFVVRVPASAPVGRYRVGFRLDDGEVVAHVDRRRHSDE